jgi:hypothetical protein
VCTSTWESAGSDSGTFGQDAMVGADPEVLAELQKRDPHARMRGDPNGPPGIEYLGTVFALSEGDESFGRSAYDTCIKTWQGAHAAACDADCQKAAAHGNVAAWPGYEAAIAACEAQQAKSMGRETSRACTLVLADVCTGHAGLDCPGEQPRYTTPTFTVEAPAAQ